MNVKKSELMENLRISEARRDELLVENVMLKELEADRDDLLGQNVILRAEKAELVEIIRHVVEHDPDRPGLHGEPIEILRSTVALPKRWLADHANDLETDAQEALPTAAEVRGILK
jgi:hypothetical protein